MPLILQLTDAGLDALVAAEASGTDAIVIAELGLTATAFDSAPTLTALPGEFKRVDMLSGIPVADNVIHMTAYDTSADVYSARGLGLYLADGTLFATYGAAEPVLSKAALAFALIAFDIAFSGDISGSIEFGNATFIYPPATESTRGVARLATQARVDAGADAGDDYETIVTPKTLRVRLAALLVTVNATIAAFVADMNATIAAFEASVNATIAAFTTSVNASLATLTGRTITGGGLVTGGGSLAANRVLTVTAASGAELQAATEAGKAVTPASFGALPRSTGAVGYEVSPRGTLVQHGVNRSGFGSVLPQESVTITFPIAFANTNYDLQVLPVIPSAGDYDNYPQEINGTRTTTGVTIFLQDPEGGGSSILSGFNWRAEGLA